MFRPQLSSEPRYARDGENVEGKRYYDFGFPLSLVTVVLGDEIQITSSRRDPGAIGKVFLVRDFVTRTMAIHRRIIAELREPV